MNQYFTHHRLSSNKNNARNSLTEIHTPSNLHNRRQGINKRKINEHNEKKVKINLLNRFNDIDSLRLRYEKLREKDVCRSMDLNERFTMIENEKENEFDIKDVHERKDIKNCPACQRRKNKVNEKTPTKRTMERFIEFGRNVTNLKDFKIMKVGEKLYPNLMIKIGLNTHLNSFIYKDDRMIMDEDFDKTNEDNFEEMRKAKQNIYMKRSSNMKDNTEEIKIPPKLNDDDKKNYIICDELEQNDKYKFTITLSKHKENVQNIQYLKDELERKIQETKEEEARALEQRKIEERERLLREFERINRIREEKEVYDKILREREEREKNLVNSEKEKFDEFLKDLEGIEIMQDLEDYMNDDDFSTTDDDEKYNNHFPEGNGTFEVNDMNDEIITINASQEIEFEVMSPPPAVDTDVTMQQLHELMQQLVHVG